MLIRVKHLTNATDKVILTKICHLSHSSLLKSATKDDEKQQYMTSQSLVKKQRVPNRTNQQRYVICPFFHVLVHIRHLVYVNNNRHEE